MKNPFRHHQSPGGTVLLDKAESWHHTEPDVDHDCARDPGSDLLADWRLEGAAAEETLDSEQQSPRTR